MAQQEWFMVKHAVTGRGLANSKTDALSYRFQQEGTGFIFTVTGLDEQTVEQIPEAQTGTERISIRPTQGSAPFEALVLCRG
ncbi:hypothetical protein [Paenibacillus sp. Z3-2]